MEVCVCVFSLLSGGIYLVRAVAAGGQLEYAESVLQVCIFGGRELTFWKGWDTPSTINDQGFPRLEH